MNGELTYAEWLPRFLRLVERRRAGASSADLSRMDRGVHRAWAPLVTACAKGYPVPRDMRQATEAREMGAWRRERFTHRGKGKPRPAPVNRRPARTFEDWLERARRLVAMIRSGERSTRIAAADPGMYKRWIGTLRYIAETDVYPNRIPSHDRNTVGERRSKITYPEWRRRVVRLAGLVREGMSDHDIRREDSTIHDYFKEIVYAVAAGDPVPPSMPCHKYRKPHRYMDYATWRGKIVRFAAKVAADEDRFTQSREFRNNLDFWNRYRAVIFRVAGGGLVPPEVHDDFADGSVFDAEEELA